MNTDALNKGFEYLKEHLDQWNQLCWTSCFGAMILRAYDISTTLKTNDEITDSLALLIQDDPCRPTVYSLLFQSNRTLSDIEDGVKFFESRNKAGAKVTFE